MVVYGHRSFELEPRRFLSVLHERLRVAAATPAHDELTSLLVDVGEAEAAVADAMMPEIDRDDSRLGGWRDIAGCIAEAHCASWYGPAPHVPAALDRAKCAVERVVQQPLPSAVRARMAEGFACYALYPEQYMEAAEQLRLATRAQAVFCLGLRSIGSILAHVVAATLERKGVRAIVRSVRPRGHPFDRVLRIDRTFEHLIATCACDVFAVVDEGPGLSGSSLAAAVDQLVAAGVDPQRVVLIPAWNAAVDQLNSVRGRRTWEAQRRFIGSYNPFEAYEAREDWSAGRWRPRAYSKDCGTWPAVQPQHERPKFVARSPGRIARFAGLGAIGGRRKDRAAMLHSAGFGPAPVELRAGMLDLEWHEGRPVEKPTDDLIARGAEYLAFIRSNCATGGVDDMDELRSMIATNVAEAGLIADADAAAHAASAATRRVAIDGRMMLHEWIDTSTGLMKVDALDHHDDDFFPGCRDIAWDVAGACVEWNLDADGVDRFVSAYRRASHDMDIERRLPFYEAAYAAYRIGYARMAADCVTDIGEARRFKGLEMRYANRLRRFQRSA